MVALFYFLATLEILLGLYLIADAFRWSGYARRRIMSHPGFYTPRLAVICPCKGMEPGLDRNLLALCEFDYPNYEVFFALASSNDPAYSLVRQIADGSKPKAHIVVAGSPQGCSEKVNNLRAAVDSSISGVGLGGILTSQSIAQEIVRTLVGSIGLIAAVPITTALAAIVAVQEIESSTNGRQTRG